LGKCQIQLSDEDKAILDEEPVSLTQAEDSDDEDEPCLLVVEVKKSKKNYGFNNFKY
jgi:hypothetical protein